MKFEVALSGWGAACRPQRPSPAGRAHTGQGQAATADGAEGEALS